jgi:hypothetical protein
MSMRRRATKNPFIPACRPGHRRRQMARMFQPVSTDKVATLRQLLRSRGLDPRDFHIEEDAQSGIGQLLGLSGGILTVRRRSTGEIRVYACGTGSAWYASVLADLDHGYFRAGVPRPAFRRSLPSALSAMWA